MKNQLDENITLEELIKQIQELLNEIKNEQTKLSKNVEKNHKVNMQNFSKLREYNKISDMTNKVFEKRISSIENLLYKVFGK